MTALYCVPENSKILVDKVIKRDWLVHNFKEGKFSELEDFLNCAYNKDCHGVNYTICLDLNVYQFILNSVKKNTKKPEYIDAIALVYLCQIMSIQLDPSIAIYEKLNYSKDAEKLTDLTEELEIFEKINNTIDDQLHQYVFGGLKQIYPTNEFNLNHESIKSNLTKCRRLTDWDSLYLFVQCITFNSLNKMRTRRENLKSVVEWMITDFRLSLVSIAYAVVYFGNRPLKRMMKFKITGSSEQKKKALTNMTWDLYALDKYFKDWTKRDENQECLYASNDKAFRDLLRICVEIQNIGDIELLGQFIDQSDLEYINEITSNPTVNFSRKYKSESWGPEYRQKLVEKFNDALGVD